MELRDLIEKRSRENTRFMRRRLGILGKEFAHYVQVNAGLWNYADLNAYSPSYASSPIYVHLKSADFILECA